MGSCSKARPAICQMGGRKVGASRTNAPKLGELENDGPRVLPRFVLLHESPRSDPEDPPRLRSGGPQGLGEGRAVVSADVRPRRNLLRGAAGCAPMSAVDRR